jgi:hypothetical protein
MDCTKTVIYKMSYCDNARSKAVRVQIISIRVIYFGTFIRLSLVCILAYKLRPVLFTLATPELLNNFAKYHKFNYIPHE